MKKTLIISAAVFGILMTGCSPSQSSSEEPAETAETQTAEPAETAETAETENKTLLVYFSRAGENWEVGIVEKGNTRIAAEYIAEQTGADVFEIIPSVPYPENYMETVTLAQEELNAGVRPEIADAPENWESYDTIILGYPIWHGDMPMIVYTFLESYDFAGKTVCPFDTHGGSGLAGTPAKIQNILPEADVHDGLALTGKTVQNDFSAVQAEIDTWLSDNDLIQ